MAKLTRFSKILLFTFSLLAIGGIIAAVQIVNKAFFAAPCCPYSEETHHEIKHNVYSMCKMEAEIKADSLINSIDFNSIGK